MRYEATDANTLAMFDKQTGERLGAMALIPGFAADMRALVDMLDPAKRRNWRDWL